MTNICFPKSMWVTCAGKKHNKYLSTPFTNTLHLVIARLILENEWTLTYKWTRWNWKPIYFLCKNGSKNPLARISQKKWCRNNFHPFSATTVFFWFGALDESSCGLCVGMITWKSCVLVNSYSSSIFVLLAMICGNY